MKHMFLLMLCSLLPATAQVPGVISYQGRISIQGVPYSGPAEIKFAFVGPDGTPVFWRNDGATTPGEPTNSVSLLVDNGGFTTLLGDTNLANMAPLPGSVFANPEVRVRIWLNAGTNTFTQLGPDQRITATGYALMAADIVNGAITSAKLAANSISAFHIASNSITAAQIASNSITGGQIAGGSITSNQLAQGTVGVQQLTKPYQAGSVRLDRYYALPGFGSYIVTQSVVFPAPFTSTPVITAGLETDLSSVADRIDPIFIRQKTTTSFALTFPVPTLPVTVATRSGIGEAPMSIVNSRPAMIFDAGNNLYYTRSGDTYGFRWPAGTVIATDAGPSKILHMVDNQPAVAYVDDNNNVRFMRAGDTNGNTWPVAMTLAVGGANFRATEVELEIINGNPAVAYWDSIGEQIYFLRANNSVGTSWPIFGTLVATGNVGIALAQINGRPAITFGWDNGLSLSSVNYQGELRYIRANDASGTTWSATPVTITNGATFTQFADTHLMTVSNNPAIAYHYLNSGISDARFIRANNIDGTAWGSQVVVLAVLQTYGIHAGIVNGRPGIVYYDIGQDAIRYAESLNNGATFGNYYAYRNSGSSNPWLLEVNGEPAISFSSPDAQELWFIRDGNPIPDSFINWIAVQP